MCVFAPVSEGLTPHRHCRAPRRYFRKGPTKWDLKAEGWTEGQFAPTTNAPPTSGAASAPTQQTRHARRVYVGGLEAVPEQEIAELFTAIIRATMITPVPEEVSPVLSVYINPERKFAFVEVATIELGWWTAAVWHGWQHSEFSYCVCVTLPAVRRPRSIPCLTRVHPSLQPLLSWP